jgi:hypothetical protein
LYKIETSGGLGWGWPTTNSWEKGEGEGEDYGYVPQEYLFIILSIFYYSLYNSLPNTMLAVQNIKYTNLNGFICNKY